MSNNREINCLRIATKSIFTVIRIKVISVLENLGELYIPGTIIVRRIIYRSNDIELMTPQTNKLYYKKSALRNIDMIQFPRYHITVVAKPPVVINYFFNFCTTSYSSNKYC